MTYPRIFSGKHEWPRIHVKELEPWDLHYESTIPVSYVSIVRWALTPMGWDFDAVEWDWPRWGRRILVSRNIRVGDPLTPSDLKRAIVVKNYTGGIAYDPHPGANHVELGWGPMPETQERRFFKRLRRAFRYG